MPKEIYPSSYIRDCGMESHHSENTIQELKEKSRRKPQILIGDDGEHEIKFERGEMVAMYCPEEQREIPAPNRGKSAHDPQQAGRLSLSAKRRKSKYEDKETVAKMNDRRRKKNIAEELAQKITEPEEWRRRKSHVRPADFFQTNQDKIKLNWFLFEFALQLESLVWQDQGLRERLKGKGIGEKEIGAFCVSYAKHMKAEIIARVSGKTQNVRMGYEPIEAYFPTIGDALVDRLLTKAAEAWDSQTEVCIVCPTRCISEKEQRASMFDDPWYWE